MSTPGATKPVTLDGQTYTAYYYVSAYDPEWNLWYLRTVPPGWGTVTDMAPRYGLVRDKLMRFIYAERVPAFRVEVGGRFTWYVPPPPPEYVPPAPPDLAPVAADLTGLPVTQRNALHRAGLRTRAQVAASPDNDLFALRGIGARGLEIIRAAISYDPAPAPSAATPPGPQTYHLVCPCCQGTGRLEVTIPGPASETTQVLDT